MQALTPFVCRQARPGRSRISAGARRCWRPSRSSGEEEEEEKEADSAGARRCWRPSRGSPEGGVRTSFCWRAQVLAPVALQYPKAEETSPRKQALLAARWRVTPLVSQSPKAKPSDVPLLARAGAGARRVQSSKQRGRRKGRGESGRFAGARRCWRPSRAVPRGNLLRHGPLRGPLCPPPAALAAGAHSHPPNP